MNYRHVYMLIIEHAKSEMELGLRPKSKNEKRYKFSECYFEFHHVLPKSLYPNWSKRKSNLVALTAREHFFCHKLLVKIFPTYEMWGTLWRMSKDGRGNKIITSREYEIIKNNFVKMQSERKKGYKPWNTGRTGVYTEEQIKRMSTARKNATTPETIKKIKEARSKQDMSWRHDWHPSIEVRNKMSQSHIGKKLSDEQKQKIRRVNSERIKAIREKYNAYKLSGGELNWNDFQKKLKLEEVKDV